MNARAPDSARRPTLVLLAAFAALGAGAAACVVAVLLVVHTIG